MFSNSLEIPRFSLLWFYHLSLSEQRIQRCSLASPRCIPAPPPYDSAWRPLPTTAPDAWPLASARAVAPLQRRRGRGGNSSSFGELVWVWHGTARSDGEVMRSSPATTLSPRVCVCAPLTIRFGCLCTQFYTLFYPIDSYFLFMFQLLLPIERYV